MKHAFGTRWIRCNIRVEAEQDTLQRQIEATDRQIDSQVYELYGLTEEEIWIVEEM